jgi:hypothetical protein
MDDADIVFWMGDLNYRLTSALPDRPIVMKAIENCDYGQLMAKDQLAVSMFMKTAFPDFEEPMVCFPPTFKTLVLGGGYDGQRVPAYCDRILYRQSDKIKCLLYDAVDLPGSDHMPVIGLFSLLVQRVERDRFGRVYRETVARMDAMENEMIPVTEVLVMGADYVGGDGYTLTFGSIYRGHVYTGQLGVFNKGTTLAEYVVVECEEN